MIFGILLKIVVATQSHKTVVTVSCSSVGQKHYSLELSETVETVPDCLIQTSLETVETVLGYTIPNMIYYKHCRLLISYSVCIYRYFMFDH